MEQNEDRAGKESGVDVRSPIVGLGASTKESSSCCHGATRLQPCCSHCTEQRCLLAWVVYLCGCTTCASGARNKSHQKGSEVITLL